MAREYHDFDPSRDTRKPKVHRIYISHDKEEDCTYFARLLAAELQSMSYDAFLSENTDTKAADYRRDCRLGVFVLSEQFIRTRSLMDELEDFVDHEVTLFPLFYKLSHSEFEDPGRRAAWREEWHGFMQTEVRAEAKIAKWECAMEKLGSCKLINGFEYNSDDKSYTLQARSCNLINGFEYNSDAKSYTQLQAISEAVCKLVPLQVYWSEELSNVGTSSLAQICDVMHKWFDDPSALHGGAQVVGMHGLWGVGKTTLGKSLCDFYSTEFGGRVCYVKLHFPPQTASSVVKLKRVREVLRKLMGISQSFLEEHVKDLGQAYAYLDQCLDDTPKKVFLVVDNVEDSWESQEEAADLFLNRGPFHPGSKVLVLARCPQTLLQLLWPFDNLCRNIKSFEHFLSSQLAEKIFLGRLSENRKHKDKTPKRKLWLQSQREGKPSSKLALEIFKQWFQAYKFILQEHMHPLFFVSLGHCLGQSNEKFWRSSVQRLQSEEHLKKALTEDDLFCKYLFKAVSDVLQETYDSLEPMEQEVFLDAALFMPRKEVQWLQQLHDPYSGVSAMLKCVSKLRAVAFLRTENTMIQVHKLCKLYAKMVATNRRTLHIEGNIKRKEDVQDRLRGVADVLERVAFENCVFESDEPFIIDLSACNRVRVLRLSGIHAGGEVQVQLGPIKLRALDVCSNHAPIYISGDLSYLKCLAGGAETFCGEKISLAWTPSPGNCGTIDLESLKVLHLSKAPACSSFRKNGLKQYVVGSRLEVLCLNCIPMDGMLRLESWPELKELTVFNVADLTELEGLQKLHNLRKLHLLYLKNLVSLTGLESLQNLRNLHVIGCKKLKALHLPDSRLLSHCCIWKCQSLQLILIGELLQANTHDQQQLQGEIQYSVSEEEDIDEITSLPYDGKSESIRPCWECSDEFICSGGDLGDSFQDRYKEYVKREQDKGLIYSSDEKKFFVYGCNNLKTVNGLSKLTSIKEFILREQQYRIARLQVVRPGLDCPEMDGAREDQPFRISCLKFVDAACLTHLTCLSVQDVKVKGFVQELLNQLEGATTLKSLLVRCDISGKCECQTYTPCFSSLSKGLAELTYSCRFVENLASIDKCTGLSKISCKLPKCDEVA